MSARLYAMDTCFETPLGRYSFDARCEIAAELGFEGSYITVLRGETVEWHDAPRIAQTKPRFGLDPVAVYVIWGVGSQDPAQSFERVLDLLRRIEGVPRLEVALEETSPENPIPDAEVIDQLRRLADEGAKQNTEILLYPHFAYRVEKQSDAVAIADQAAHPNLGCVFTAVHWYLKDPAPVAPTLDAMKPHLRLANVCGVWKQQHVEHDPEWRLTTCDQGNLDLFQVIGQLARVDYHGWLGLQGWSVGGDVYANLERSRDAIRAIENRVARRPLWLELQQ